MGCQIKTYKIVNIISSIILIIASAFIMTQSIINFIFSENNNKHIIAERLVYEQFSHEVYSNIESKIITDIVNDDGTTLQDYDVISIPIKLESFYDCEDVYKDEIDEDICQNKITSSSLCCRKECCIKKITGKKEIINYCSNKKNINDYDPRNNYCSKFSKYNGRFYKYKNNKIRVKRSNLAYEDLLLNYENKNYYCYTYIAIDSKGHPLCYYESFNNNNAIIVKNIFSTVKPNYFEMESKIKLSILLNKNKEDENKINKEINRLSKITSKNIYETFMDKKCQGEECLDNGNYKIKESANIEDTLLNSDEFFFKDFKSNDYIKRSDINWYTRNYIGFENSTELNKFKRYFDSNDHKNNPLYKISTTLFPNLGSFIFCAIICIFSVISIILLIINFKGEDIDFKLKGKTIPFNFIRLGLIFILFWIYFIIYFAIYRSQFEEINIDMEEFYKKVLDKYNYRRRQIYLVIGIIIFFFNLFIELLLENLRCSITYNENTGFNINPANPINSIIVRIKIRDNNCNRQHKIKLYLKKPFSEYIQKIKKIYSKCNICNLSEIEQFSLNENEIQQNDIVENIGLTEDSTIIIN